MSDNKDNKKKGFFASLFGRSDAPEKSKDIEKSSPVSDDIPSISALNKMKKADIVASAKDNGLELDVNLTKAKLIEEWDLHFNPKSSVKEDMSEESPVEEEAPAEEEAPVEEEVADEIKISLEEKTPSQIIDNFESKQLKTDLPDFRPGDTVVVSVRVREGERTRLQAFEGVVMGVKKGGLNSSFIVRKISNGIGVERTFQTHSPMIDSVKVKRKGDVRQAKLFYLRERSGKSARIKERLE